MNYPYDPDTRKHVSGLLYEALPSLYRVQDMPPKGRGELEQLIKVLAAPLAVLRQNIEELHADLFIDSANDWTLPYLARMVGTTLIFPDADSNRSDVRSTVSFRRRKGTPSMLQDLGQTLTGQMVVTREGWQLVQMTQDIKDPNLLRPDRVVTDTRPAILAEIAEGPLVDSHHFVDIRAIATHTGQFHPRHATHWVHPTQLSPVEHATATDLRDPATDPDFRYAFHPLGVLLPLRARREHSGDRLIKTDRVPAMHFAQQPGNWFDKPGRFSVQICGLPAAITPTADHTRRPTQRAASPQLMDGNVTITLLEHDGRHFHGPMLVQVVSAPLLGPVPSPADTGAPAIEARAQLQIDRAGASGGAVINGGAIGLDRVVMIRLQAVGALGRSFPGAVIEITNDSPTSVLESHDGQLAQEGFLRGGLFVQLPPTQLNGDRWWYLAADGSIYDAQSTGSGPADVSIGEDATGARLLPTDRLLASGPGAAWPPLPAVADPLLFTGVPGAPGRGPTVMHGGAMLEEQAGGLVPAGATVTNSLVFALRIGMINASYHPFVRLAWDGPDPAGATWEAIADNGQTTNIAPRFLQIAQLRDGNPDAFRLVARFECQQPNARLAPAEVSWMSEDGRVVLIHLPSLATAPGAVIAGWSTDPAFVAVSDAVTVAQDGSTWEQATGFLARRSLGQIAPLAPYTPLRRRKVRHRSLCQWQNENPPGLMHEATAPGWLDIDVPHGLFAMALSEPPQPLPPDPQIGPPPPPSVTVSYQEGYSDHTGARPNAREPELDQRLETPTRIVTASGHLHRNAPANWHAIPRFSSLADALAAIAAGPAPVEVVQFEDSATYDAQSWVWPAGCDQLIIQAAETQRPVIRIANWSSDPGAQYDEVILRGLCFGSDTVTTLQFPPTGRVAIQFCTVWHADNNLVFDLAPNQQNQEARVLRSITAGLSLQTAGRLIVSDSVIDSDTAAGPVQPAITATLGSVQLDRVTVFGTVASLALDASEVIFNNDATVTDRFQGCVRYSRVTGASVLPRTHRVVRDVPVAYVTRQRHTPAHARLAQEADTRILRGAEDGGEMGAFHRVRLDQRYVAYRRRLEESTPAGLQSGIIRMD